MVTQAGAVTSTEAKGADFVANGFELRDWFTRLVRVYVKRYRSRHPEPKPLPEGVTQSEACKKTIFRACMASAATGTVSGATSTTAAVLAAQTQGLAGLWAIPVGLGAMGAEMMARTIIHLHMTLELGDIFAMPWDPSVPADLWQLYGLSFGTENEEEKSTDSEDPGRELLGRIIDSKAESIGQRIGAQLFGESIVRNVVPFVSIVSSSTTNWVRTRNLGDTVRRYLRYRRALDDAVAPFENGDTSHFELLIEGIWFLFIADGRLKAEEAVTLANLLQRLPTSARHALAPRFVDDELDWTERLCNLPEPLHDEFLHALEVAASVDKIVSLPERKILRRAALELGRKIEPAVVDEMVNQLEKVGVLTFAGRPVRH